MAVNVGSAPNDGNGDPLRAAFIKLNDTDALLQQQVNDVRNRRIATIWNEDFTQTAFPNGTSAVLQISTQKTSIWVKLSAAPSSVTANHQQDVNGNWYEMVWASDDTVATIRDSGVFSLATVAGTPNAIVGEISPVAADLGVTITSNTIVELRPIAPNTGNTTLAVGTDGARALLTEQGGQLPAGYLVAGQSYLVRRTSTGSWRIIAGSVSLVDLIDRRVATVWTESFATVHFPMGTASVLQVNSAKSSVWGKLGTTAPSPVLTGDQADADGIWWRKVWDSSTTRQALRNAGVFSLVNVAGTADAITASLHQSAVDMGITIDGSTSVDLVPSLTNTGPVTLLVEGDSARAIQTETGAALTAGQLKAGVAIRLRRQGSSWRIASGVGLTEFATERTARALANAIGSVVMLENIGGSGDAINGDIPTALTGSGIAASNLRHIRFSVPATNTISPPTINVGGSGPVGIYDNTNNPVAVGFFQVGRIYEAEKVSGRWRLMSSEVTKTRVDAMELARQEGDALLQTQVTALVQKDGFMATQITQLQQEKPFAGDPPMVAEDGVGNAAAWFDDEGTFRVPAVWLNGALAGDDAIKVLTDAAGRGLIWVNMLLGKMGFAPIDWSTQSLEGFDWSKAFVTLHAGDPLILFEDSVGNAIMWVDDSGRLIGGGGGGGGGISRPLPATSGNAWQVIDDGTSIRYLSDQYQGRVMGFEERDGLILADTSTIAVGILAYGGGSASVSRQMVEDWRYNIRLPDLAHSGGMLSAEALAAASLSLQRAARRATNTMIALTASVGSPVAADTNVASTLFSSTMAQIAQAVLTLEDWGKSLIVDRITMSLLGGAPDTTPLTADNEYASVASALRAQIVTATKQAQPPLVLVAPSAGPRTGGGTGNVMRAEARLDQTHPTLGFVVVGPRHAYDLEPATVATLTRQGATLLTELEAIATREINAGNLWFCPILMSATISGSVITAQFQSMTDLVLDAGGEHGFLLEGVSNGVTISNVTFAGKTATIHLSGVPTGALVLHCASGRSGTPSGNRPINRSDIRDQWGEASLQVAGHTHRRRALPAAVTVS